MKKPCCKCKQIKKLEAFSKNRSCKDGLAPDCRDCRSADQRQRHAKYLAEVKAGEVEKKPTRVRPKKVGVPKSPMGKQGLSRFSSHSYIEDSNKTYDGMMGMLNGMFPKDKDKTFKHSQI